MDSGLLLAVLQYFDNCRCISNAETSVSVNCALSTEFYMYSLSAVHTCSEDKTEEYVDVYFA